MRAFWRILCILCKLGSRGSHNFVKVGDNWLKLCNLAHMGTCNRCVKNRLKILNRLWKKWKKMIPLGGIFFWLKYKYQVLQQIQILTVHQKSTPHRQSPSPGPQVSPPASCAGNHDATVCAVQERWPYDLPSPSEVSFSPRHKPVVYIITMLPYRDVQLYTHHVIMMMMINVQYCTLMYNDVQCTRLIDWLSRV